MSLTELERRTGANGNPLRHQIRRGDAVSPFRVVSRFPEQCADMDMLHVVAAAAIGAKDRSSKFLALNKQSQRVARQGGRCVMPASLNGWKSSLGVELKLGVVWQVQGIGSSPAILDALLFFHRPPRLLPAFVSTSSCSSSSPFLSSPACISGGKSIPTLLAVKRTRSSSFMFMPGLYRSSSVIYPRCAFR
jgi:hypothetical protein